MQYNDSLKNHAYNFDVKTFGAKETCNMFMSSKGTVSVF
jgi:hypothetical protein